MAWNEPGGSGNKDKDPWGGGGDQGPPDLDEVVKKMQDKFGSIFGGKSGGKGGGASGGGFAVSSASIGLIAIVAIAIWAVAGIFTVDEGKRAVVLQFGAFKESTGPGLHWVPRIIQSYEVVDVEKIRDTQIGYRSAGSNRQAASGVEREALMLTKDENIVDVQIAVQYKIKSASDYLFNVKDPDTTLRQATESALREIIGKNVMDFVLTEGRGQISSRVQDLTQEILDRYKTGMVVTSVNLQNAQPPEQVQAAFADAVKAREDNERLKNEAEAYANDIIPRARGKAAREVEEANAYKEQVIAEATGESQRFNNVLAEYKKAPEVTRQRLYLESVESVMQNSSKVMLDVSKGNSLMYLPLDKIMEQGGANVGNLPRVTDVIPERTQPEQRTRDSARTRSSR